MAIAGTSPGRFLDQVEDSAHLVMGAKIQVWGGPETGKSHDAYENLPRPLIVIDSDVSAGLFNDDRFAGFNRLGPDRIPDLETLIAFLGEFTSDARWHRHFRSVLIDSLTQLVDPVVAELGIDNSSPALATIASGAAGARSRTAGVAGRAQADWARIAKELTRLIRRVSALGVHIYVVAEERTRFAGQRPGEGIDGAKSSLSPKKFTHAFDLILQKISREEVIVRKSRYRGWAKDERLAAYAATRDLAPLLIGARAKRSGFRNFDPATASHEELFQLLQSLGSEARGGRIPLAAMHEYLALAKNNEASESDARRAINAIRRLYGPPTA